MGRSLALNQRPSASVSDPFIAPIYRALSDQVSQGKTRAYPGLRAGERTGVFIIAGQSLAAASSEGLFTPTNTGKVDQINQMTGEMLVGADPLVGPSVAVVPTQRATTFTRVADQLITAGKYDRVILIPSAMGGTTAQMWADEFFNLIVNGYRRALALDIPITAILWQQGETDTGVGTSQSSYTSSINSMRGKVIAAGCTAPWLLAKSTYVPGGATSAPVRAAITALINGTTILAGPDCDTLGSSYRYDDQHWNTSGNSAAALLWRNSIQAAL